MDNRADMAPSRPSAGRTEDPVSDDAVWHGGWAIAMALVGAVLLLTVGGVSGPILTALAIMAAPGVIGVVWRPDADERFALLACWALGAALAASAGGGLSGPLAMFCLAPLAACVAIDGPWRAGAGFSIGAAAFCGLIGLLRLGPTSPSEAARSWLTLLAIVTLAAAGGTALLFSRRKLGAEGRTIQADLIASAPVEAALNPPDPDLASRLAAAESAWREAEMGRDKAEANATARARFLANMSHELRTPLNAIMGFSDMMRHRMFGDLAPKYAEYADLIHESGGHLLDLINDVLDMSKIEAQRYTLFREVFDVRDALSAAVRLMRLQADDAGVKLRSISPPGPLMVEADKRAIKQIALNLLSNALKFTPRAGTVILSAQAVNGVFELVVADTGMGIAEDDLKRLGQPFEQAGADGDRSRGTGLGLSLVDAFVKLHGGAMTLESRLGEGTAATVRMPILIAPPDQPLKDEPGEVDAAPAPAPPGASPPIERPSAVIQTLVPPNAVQSAKFLAKAQRHERTREAVRLMLAQASSSTEPDRPPPIRVGPSGRTLG